MITKEKILLIGCDSQVLSSIKIHIQTHPDWESCNVDVVPSLKRALRELSIIQYALIFVDCTCFELSPIEMLLEVRKFCKNAPIILINHAGQEKTAISCLKNGADYYLIKDTQWQEDLHCIMDQVMKEYEEKDKLKKRIRLLEQENRQWQENALMDRTTLFYSEKHFCNLLARELKRANRYNFNLTCLVMDLENEQTKRGENEDAIYEKLALLLKSVVRSCDIWARLHDNQFAALLPHTTTVEARNAMRRIGSEIKGNWFKSYTDDPPFTIRWGCAKYDKKKVSSEQDLLNLAVSSLR